jgi:pyruvate kinase
MFTTAPMASRGRFVPDQSEASRDAMDMPRDPIVTGPMVEQACWCAVAEEFAKPGDAILISAGMPFGTPDGTNLLRIATV